MSRLKEKYFNEVREKLQKELNIKNVMQIPRVEKVVISVGAGKYARDKKVMASIQDAISKIAGQKAVITKARKWDRER